MKTIYPVGDRPHRARILLSLLAMASATMVLLGPSRSSAPEIAKRDVASEVVSADSVAGAPAAKETATPRRRRFPPVVLVDVPATNGSAAVKARSVAPATFVELGALDSYAGEMLDGFLVRVAQAMDAFTSTTGHEVCGVIMASDDSDAWRVRLTTNRSHIGCLMVSFDEPGFHRFGTDIHSHPRLVGGTRINAQDVLRRPDFECGGTAFVFDETFSGVDLARGPGYLVSRNRLLYQHGADKPFRQMAQFESLTKAPALAIGGQSGRSDVVLPADEAASAAWANEDRAGIPRTECETGMEGLPTSPEQPLSRRAPPSP